MSRRWLVLAALPAVAVVLAACGGSPGQDPLDAISGSLAGPTDGPAQPSKPEKQIPDDPDGDGLPGSDPPLPAPTATGTGEPGGPPSGPAPGEVDPDDPMGVAEDLGVTLVDPVDAGMVTGYGTVDFRSPSGNIRCSMADAGDADPDGNSARCDVAEYTYRPPPRTTDCPLDWGGAVGVSVGSYAEFLCVGDAVDGGPPLDYGFAVLVGGVICVSREDGMSCFTVTGDGHGFRIAKADYQLY